MSGHTDSPPPLAEQARELLLRVRSLEATVARVDALAETWERRARTYSDVDERDKARDVRARATALRRALDGDQ